MKFPDYLGRTEIKTKVDYEWTRRIGNSFQAVPGEDYPKLWDALEEISVRAAYALAIACSEWVVARLRDLSDTTDAMLRIEAAWAGLIDYRYASLPKPVTPKTPSGPDPIAEPLWLAQLFLTYLHDGYIKTHSGTPNQGVRGSALRLALLAKHVVPKKAGFDKWLSASLKKAKQHYPAKETPVQEEPPVSPHFFDPEFKWSPAAVAESQARFLTTLNPSRNPYLRKAEEMKTDGFNGDPYPQGSGQK